VRTDRVHRGHFRLIVSDPGQHPADAPFGADARMMRGPGASGGKEGRFSGFVPGSAVLE